MKSIKSVIKVLFVIVLVSIFVFFLYANINPPSLGERLYLKNPTQIMVANFPDSFTASDSASLKKYLSENNAIYSSVITMNSNTVCVTYDPRKMNRKEALNYTTAFNHFIKERVMPTSLKECPVNLLLFKRMKYAFCIR